MVQMSKEEVLVNNLAPSTNAPVDILDISEGLGATLKTLVGVDDAHDTGSGLKKDCLCCDSFRRNVLAHKARCSETWPIKAQTIQTNSKALEDHTAYVLQNSVVVRISNFIMSSYNICDELLDEIFQRLPSKTLLQFRSLSKSWCCRISSPDFILKQTALQSARNCEKILILHRTSHSKNLYTLHYPVNSRFEYNATEPLEFPAGSFVGSCNGIICMRDEHNDNYSLWNPSIRHKLTLPYHSIRRKLTLPYHDFSRKYYTIDGFGFDSNTDDYKIVRLLYPIDGEVYKSMVYSLKKRVWCEITPPSTHIMRVWPHACFVNGALHWVLASDFVKDFILTFDLSTHVFSEIPFPPMNTKYLIGPINFIGSLGISFTSYCYTCFWVMKEYNNNTSWYMVLELENFQFQGGVDAVLLIKNGNMLIRNDKNVYEVGYPGGVCSKVCVRDSPTVKINGMVMYVESLALLDIGTVCYTEQIVLS
ncbi:F-box/kelch-repeat protein At3g23880-like [Rutidosis leptorrhynchoides]|uniref:F-box/kelch-repeat protein At3g23880-like n=1 Tax=Rutidosis leptorrhynchoides TaxID=125765 RepID=UPI003A99CC90